MSSAQQQAAIAELMSAVQMHIQRNVFLASELAASQEAVAALNKELAVLKKPVATPGKE